MKVALIHEWLTSMAGSERVLLELSKIYPEASIFTSVFDSNRAKAFANSDIKTSFLQKIPLMKSKRELLVPLTPFAFEQFNLSEYDLVISSSHMAAKGVLTKPKTIHISYCHTPPRYLWEPDVDPRASKGLFSGIRSGVAHKMRIWDRIAADRVDYFMANSYYIRNRIKKYYNREAEVIYPPVNIERFKPANKNEIGEYFLFVSRLVGYKKCDLVIEAFNELGLPLKIIGSGPELGRLKQISKKNIEFLGFVPDNKVNDYFAQAKAFVFPAEEDFGIVAVEAMAAGRPVIAYQAGGAAETVKEGLTGTLFAEQSSQCLARAISQFKAAEFDPSAIVKHAEQFSSERFRLQFQTAVGRIVKEHIAQET